MIRKNAKVFALVLAIVMMLSTAAFAAEGDHFVNGKLKYSANQVRADVSAKNHVRVAPSEFQIEVEGKLYDLADANAAYEEDKANWKEILKGEDPSEDLKVVEVSAINATTLKVEFSDAVAEEDQAEIAVEVKDKDDKAVEGFGAAVWAEDGKSFTVAKSGLATGIYAVSVLKGEEVLKEESVEVVATEIVGMKIKETEAEATDSLTVVYVDNYGNEGSAVTFGNVVATVVNKTNANSVVTLGAGYAITDGKPGTDDAIAEGDVLEITLVDRTKDIEPLVHEITVVATPVVKSVTLGTPVVLDSSDKVTTSLIKDDFAKIYVKINAEDQYGKEISALPLGTVVDGTVGASAADLTFSTVTLTEDQIEGLEAGDYILLTNGSNPLATDATVKVRLVLGTEIIKTDDIVVKASRVAKTVELAEAAPAEITESGTVDFKVIVKDQYGDVVKGDISGDAIKIALGAASELEDNGTTVTTANTTPDADGVRTLTLSVPSAHSEDTAKAIITLGDSKIEETLVIIADLYSFESKLVGAPEGNEYKAGDTLKLQIIAKKDVSALGDGSELEDHTEYNETFKGVAFTIGSTVYKADVTFVKGIANVEFKVLVADDTAAIVSGDILGDGSLLADTNATTEKVTVEAGAVESMTATYTTGSLTVNLEDAYGNEAAVKATDTVTLVDKATGTAVAIADNDKILADGTVDASQIVANVISVTLKAGKTYVLTVNDLTTEITVQ